MPESGEDQAKSILLSDHNMDPQALKEVSKNISAGVQPAFDEKAIAEMAEEFEEFRKNPPPSLLGCQIIAWLLVGTMIVLFIAVIVLLVLAKWHR